MANPDNHELMLRLTLMLDGCIELLDREAAKERRREEGKRMRQVTMQKRAKAAREVVAEAEEALGVDLNPAA